MEVKHYTLFQGGEKNIPYTFVRIGTREFYLERGQYTFLKKVFILSLTFASICTIL